MAVKKTTRSKRAWFRPTQVKPKAPDLAARQHAWEKQQERMKKLREER